jgi:prepilin signal peptidase PulO-like enzyme (type II secretory pathway)
MVMVVLFLGIIGISLGSFVNALVWRLHEQEELKEKKPKGFKKRLAALSISKGRSMCPNCRHQLYARDLVPVLSWLSLGGKCRYCKKPISAQYPVVELLMGLLFAVSYLAWPLQLVDVVSIIAFGLWLIMLTGFMAHVVYDSRWYTLLDKVTLPLTIIGLVYICLQAYVQSDLQVLVGAGIGALALFGLFYGLFQVSGGAWIGGGDVKLAPLLGLLADGFLEVTLLLFVSSVLGTVYAGLYALAHQQKLRGSTRIPFGPFLITGVVFVVLWGDAIIQWYTSFLTGV